MVFNTLYNLTDFWFAGQLSSDALAGVSIAGSVFFLLLALGLGIQIGAAALIAPIAGQSGDDDERRGSIADWVDQILGLSLVLSLVVLIAGLLVATPLVHFLGAEVNTVAPLALEYIGTILWGAFTFILTFAAAGALMALGDTHSNRNALAIGFVANLGLNPLLTFGLDMGVTGLALATVLIKGASALYLYRVLTRRLGRRCRPRFSSDKWAALLRQTIPASGNMLTIILGGFITVALIGRFGSQHVAGYSVGLRLEQVLLLPALGLNSAVMAIAGQNLGAGHLDRVRQIYTIGLQLGLAMAAVFIPIMVFLSPVLMGFFSDDPDIQHTGAIYLKIDAIAFYAYVVLFLSTATLQALKQPMFPLILGVARQLVIPASINYWLIVYQGFPMISIFYTIISVVVISSLIAHGYTLRQLGKLQVNTPATSA
ncbi:Multidrug export protein MepA [Granulosicoccus antarcticus IMCC3135]|uniref:Multidrug export protein MepA n=2 Tax=Granulosicoccus TaxID=437504 RepID=A0A2Z2NRC9_9GAMM|nr:Multidrug export protein MepA [Granulosicoccus antarcticus IMCC3135]